MNKGLTTEYMTQASGFFERALALDPSNVEALVGTASGRLVVRATNLCPDDRAARPRGG